MTRGICAVLALATLGATLAIAGGQPQGDTPSTAAPLHPPWALANGIINVAFLVSHDTDLIDLAGPWEVFGETMLTREGRAWHGGENMVMPFHMYTVSDSRKPISAGGVEIIPTYTFENAPKPQVIVIPAQGGRSEAQRQWLLKSAQGADLTASVCTGVSILAADGFLDHRSATTHHFFVKDLQKAYPQVQFVSGLRYVDNGNVATAGGLSSGIDLALHIVDRYYGEEVAQATADYLEYKSELWKGPLRAGE
jgi:transcriptional regulator GlxA family with amidase domain